MYKWVFYILTFNLPYLFFVNFWWKKGLYFLNICCEVSLGEGNVYFQWSRYVSHLFQNVSQLDSPFIVEHCGLAVLLIHLFILWKKSVCPSWTPLESSDSFPTSGKSPEPTLGDTYCRGPPNWAHRKIFLMDSHSSSWALNDLSQFLSPYVPLTLVSPFCVSSLVVVPLVAQTPFCSLW